MALLIGMYFRKMSPGLNPINLRKFPCLLHQREEGARRTQHLGEGLDGGDVGPPCLLINAHGIASTGCRPGAWLGSCQLTIGGSCLASGAVCWGLGEGPSDSFFVDMLAKGLRPNQCVESWNNRNNPSGSSWRRRAVAHDGAGSLLVAPTRPPVA